MPPDEQQCFTVLRAAEWRQIIAGCGLDKHMAIVGYLKSEHGMGHGHANALVGWTLQGNTARPAPTAG
jgi:hypothetical protein